MTLWGLTLWLRLMANHPNRNIRNRLRQLMSEPIPPDAVKMSRWALKMSQQKLADQLGMSLRQIQYMESGEQAVELRTWYSLILLMAVNGAVG